MINLSFFLFLSFFPSSFFQSHSLLFFFKYYWPCRHRHFLIPVVDYATDGTNIQQIAIYVTLPPRWRRIGCTGQTQMQDDESLVVFPTSARSAGRENEFPLSHKNYRLLITARGHRCQYRHVNTVCANITKNTDLRTPRMIPRR